MHLFDILHKGFTRLLPAAALLTALFVPLISASAEDECPPRGCPLAPPQSREVNPASAFDGPLPTWTSYGASSAI